MSVPMKARRAVLGWVLFAMVCAQALGLLHRVTHLPVHAATPVPVAVGAEQSHSAAQAANWALALFAHDDESGCRLLDGVGQCATPLHAPAMAAPLAPAAQPLLFADAGPSERRASHFLARGPPLSR